MLIKINWVVVHDAFGFLLKQSSEMALKDNKYDMYSIMYGLRGKKPPEINNVTHQRLHKRKLNKKKKVQACGILWCTVLFLA